MGVVCHPEHRWVEMILIWLRKSGGLANFWGV